MKILYKLASIMLFVMPICSYTSMVYAEDITESELEERISLNKEELEKTQEQISITEGKINSKKEQLTEINMILDDMEIMRLEKYNDIKLRIKYLYERGDTSLIEALVTSEGYTDVLNKTELSSRLHDYDREKLEEYESLINEIKEKRVMFDNAIVELETLNDKNGELQRCLSNQIDMDEFKLSKINEEKKAKEAEKKKAATAAAAAVAPTYTVVMSDNSYIYGQEDLELIYAIVMQEGGSDYDSALAVITCACNRAVSSQWSYLGADPLSQLTAKSQFCYSFSSSWKKYLGNNVPQTVRDAVTDAMNGKRNHSYLSFRGYVVSGGLCIGGNYYFSSLN